MTVYPIPDMNSELWNIGSVLAGLCHFMLRDTVTCTGLLDYSESPFFVIVAKKTWTKVIISWFQMWTGAWILYIRNSWRRHPVSWDWATQNTISHGRICHKSESELKASQNLAHLSLLLCIWNGQWMHR